MFEEKLSLKLCLKWLSLKYYKEQPLTVEECYNILNERLKPPPQPGKPKRKYSIDKVRKYLKELTDSQELIEGPGEPTSYSITKLGHNLEKERRKDLYERVTVVHYSLEMMKDYLHEGRSAKSPLMVPQKDREFVRSLISVKDVVRIYILQSLLKEKEQSLTILRKNMLNEYGWSCSPTYFNLIGRNEMTEGVDEDDEPLRHPVIFLSSRYKGNLNRRKSRVYYISNRELVDHWLPVFLDSALESIDEALSFNTSLIRLLKSP